MIRVGEEVDVPQAEQVDEQVAGNDRQAEGSAQSESESESGFFASTTNVALTITGILLAGALVLVGRALRSERSARHTGAELETAAGASKAERHQNPMFDNAEMTMSENPMRLSKGSGSGRAAAAGAGGSAAEEGEGEEA